MGLFHRKSSRPTVVNGNGHYKPGTNGSLFPSNPIPAVDVALPKAPDPAIDPAAYLRSIYAVRERTKLVFEKAQENQLRHFTVDMSKFADTAAYVVSIIKVCLVHRSQFLVALLMF